MAKKELYGFIRNAGILSALPFILLSGPVAGYLAADFLRERFGSGEYVFYVLVITGLCASIFETARILIRIINKSPK